MTPRWQVEALIELVRLRYEAWTDFDHPLFVADEVEYKQKAVAQAAAWLNQAEFDQLIASEAFDTILERLDKLAKATNLLFLRVPSQGDTAVLHNNSLDKAAFCTQLRNLLYADRPTPDRLQTFSDYLTTQNLPNKWVFPTYYLFLCHPDVEMFVKPQTAEWFLKFMGQPMPVSGAPDAATYAAIRQHVHSLRNDLLPYGVHDMVDVQSMIWVGYREAKARIGRLDPKGQIELGVPEFVAEPPLVYEMSRRTAVIREANEELPTLVKKEPVMSKNDYFTIETFDLLAALHENPTKDFYDSHQDEFRQYVEEPFQELMREVADELPIDILVVMETRKRLFSHIRKNDYGQGGAWDFYWGAFYPKGGKRTGDAQLSMVITHEFLDFGFHIGEYAQEKRVRFAQYCQTHYTTLMELLQPHLTDEQIVFGKRESYVIQPDGSVQNQQGTTFADWLQNPTESNFNAKIMLPKMKVLQLTADQLRQQIIDIYQKFFPLVLLAIEDDPLPHILAYLQSEPTHIVETLTPVAESEEVNVRQNPPYSLATCAAETGYAEADLARWVRAIERKGQAVFYGPPGTGKTFLAERLARHLIGGGGFVESVQFHPAYAYEDFMQGIRPFTTPDGTLSYDMVHGRFYTFCQQARKRSDTCVFIIDEINRANVAGVFGELMYLLEYRDQEIALSGGGRFSIPGNVHLLATMNTADRSIALVDHALRRRFAFVHLPPNYNLLRHYHQATDYDPTSLIRVLDRLNKQINDPHYQLGTSFFMRPDLITQLEDIWRMEVEPYLEEYFFDQTNQIEAFRWQKIKREIGE